jgi:hypothetical protein
MKQVLQERFADFVRLFAPEIADGLDLDAGITFRNTETFTDLPQGVLLVPDIVAEVRTRVGSAELIIIHIEIQRTAEPEDFPRRMWRYYLALVLREDKPVIPIALLFYLRAEGLAWEVYENTLFGHTIVSFRYLQISLARLAPHAMDYVQSGNVLAAALAGIMGRTLRGTERARLYYGCVHRLIEAERAGEVNRATMELLGDVVETYLPLSGEDRVALRQAVEQEGGDLMTLDATELTWRSRIDLEATLRTRREDVRKVVQAHFGRVSPEVEAVISGAQTEEALTALFDRALAVQVEADLLAPVK